MHLVMGNIQLIIGCFILGGKATPRASPAESTNDLPRVALLAIKEVAGSVHVHIALTHT